MSRDIDTHTKALERRANVVRSRLLRTIDALDTRRHQVTEVGAQAKEIAPKAAMLLLGIAAVSACVVLGIRHYVRSPKERFLSYRVEQFLRQFRVEKPPSFAVQVAQRLTFTVVTMVATETSRRVMKNFVDGRMPDGRLAVGHALDLHHEAMKG